MSYLIKKVLFIFILNTSLLSMLILGIQNNSNKNKVNLLVDKSVELPIGFIAGVSFISGSIIGSCLTITNIFRKE